MIFADPGPMFADPPPPPHGGPTGLLPADCARCLSHTLAAPAYRGEVLCARCRVGPGVPASWLLARPRYAGGWTAGGAVTGAAVAVPPKIGPAVQEVIRILRRSTAQHELIAEQPPKAAREALHGAQAAGHARADLRYAFAEDLARGRMAESWALRVPGLGYALWVNGLADSAAIRWNGRVRSCSITEFVARAAGREYLPPPPRPPAGRAVCERCGAEVRVTTAGAPYAHKRVAPGAEGAKGEKIACV